MTDKHAAQRNALVDNLIVHASSPNENGGTIVELRFRVVDPGQAAAFTNIDIEWLPEDRQWALRVTGDLEVTATATISLDGPEMAEAIEALDTHLARETNVN